MFNNYKKYKKINIIILNLVTLNYFLLIEKCCFYNLEFDDISYEEQNREIVCFRNKICDLFLLYSSEYLKRNLSYIIDDSQKSDSQKKFDIQQRLLLDFGESIDKLIEKLEIEKKEKRIYIKKPKFFINFGAAVGATIVNTIFLGFVMNELFEKHNLNVDCLNGFLCAFLLSFLVTISFFVFSCVAEKDDRKRGELFQSAITWGTPSGLVINSIGLVIESVNMKHHSEKKLNNNYS